jgi:hypothetical protein
LRSKRKSFLFGDEMAGTILIRKGGNLVTSTIVFDYIVERIRPILQYFDAEILRKIYDPLDEGAMTFIAANELSRDDFLIFVKATKKAYENSVQEPSFVNFKDRWLELIDLLEADPRYQSGENVDGKS